MSTAGAPTGGKCSLPYMREQDVSDRLGELLKQIYVPETICKRT